MTLPLWLTIVVVLIVAILVAFVAYKKGISDRIKTAEALHGSAEEEARRIVNDAIKSAEQKRKETLLEAKDEIYKMKADGEKELKERRSEVTRQERRLNQKEENLDKKTEALEKKEADIRQKELLVSARLDEIEQMKQRQLEKL